MATFADCESKRRARKKYYAKHHEKRDGKTMVVTLCLLHVVLRWGPSFILPYTGELSIGLVD